MRKLRIISATFLFIAVCIACFAGCSFDISSLISPETSFTPAADSSPISGAPKIADEEIFLPCTVKDLKNKGFETDYLIKDGSVKMWHIEEEQRGNNLDMYVYPDKGYDYKDNDIIKDDDTVAAIKVIQSDHIELDLNGIRIWTSKEDVLKISGTPAYEKKLPFDGEYYFYLGDNDQIYRLKFLATDRLEEFLVGTKEYMTDEKGRLYTG
ncbi:MAG: hypothetical protein IKF09_02845 [Clostridiales bacterium]|nr:hypothetical protein [Clostridiales bacterium]